MKISEKIRGGNYDRQDVSDLLSIFDELSKDQEKLRHAAYLCWRRGYMVSGSMEMAECDAFCKSVGLEPWIWKRCIK